MIAKKSKPTVRVGRKAKDLAGEIHELPGDSRVAKMNG